jgi:hypothetical protein
MRNPGRLIFVLMLLYGAPLFAQSAPSSGYHKAQERPPVVPGSFTLLGFVH